MSFAGPAASPRSRLRRPPARLVAMMGLTMARRAGALRASRWPMAAPPLRAFPGWHESGTARRRYPRRSRRWPGPARRASRRNRQRAAAHAGPGGRSRTSPGLAWPRRKKRRPSQQNQLGLRCGRPSRLPDMLVHAAADERTRSGSDDSVPAGTPSAFAARVPAETLTAVTSATGPDVSSRTADRRQKPISTPGTVMHE